MQLTSINDLIEKDKEEKKLTPIGDLLKQNKPEKPQGNFTAITELVQQNKPKQPIQDIAQITPEPVEAPSEPVMSKPGYIAGKVYSTLIEKPIVQGMGAPVSSALEKGFRVFGLNDLADKMSEVTKWYQNPPVTKNVQQHTAYLREQAYGESMLSGVGFDIVESTTQLMGLLTQIAATKKIPALQGKGIMDTFKVMAGHAIATTPGGIDDRLKAAVYRMGYSMTPFIANATGATGLTAVAVDTALNTFLTSPTYMKAFKEAENPEQFFQMAIPQLVMDIGMAWNTRGLPANQRIAEYNKMWNKVEGQVSKLKPEEFNKLAEDVNKVYQAKQKMETKVEQPKPESTIPKELEPLAQEAKKYGSAKEFVEAQTKVYHGTATDFDVFSKNINWFADNKQYAEEYSRFKEGKSPQIKTAVIKKDNLFNFNFRDLGAEASLSDIKSRIRKQVGQLFESGKISKDKGLSIIQQIKNIKDAGEIKKAYEWIQDEAQIKKVIEELGYDGIMATEKGNTTYGIFNPNKIYTEQQLTDIYNQAKSPTPSKPAEVKPEPKKAEIPEFIKQAENVSIETDKAIQSMIEERYQELKIIRDTKTPSDKGVIRDSDGRTIDRYNISNRPLWYQELYKDLGNKRPTNADLRDEAARQLREQDANFIRMEADRDAYQNVRETWEEFNFLVEKPENNFTIDERGSVILPSKEMVSDTITKLKSFWDVEAPFVKIGANETGFRVKNYYSEIETGLTRGTELIQNITSQGRKTGLKDTDYSEVTYATESPVYKMKLDSETRNKIEPLVKEVNNFYKGWENKLKEIGWMEEPFPQSLLSRNNKLIEGYQKQLKLDLPNQQKTKVQKSIADLQAQNQKIKDLDLQFVSVPIRMIIEGADTAVGKHFMSILPHWGRKTLTIKDLVDEGVLTPEQADIRNIIAEYSDRMSRKYALGQIFKSAEEDGLITQASEKPEWPEFSAKIIPQLKGKVLHPAFNDMLNAYFGVTYSTGIAKAYETVVGITKMMQFYNPVFLPMYDTIQGFAAGTFTSKNTPQSIKQALNDIPITIGKIHRPASENYIEAMENGLFSQPFVINYKTYTEQIKDILSNQKFKEATSKLGKNPVMGLYQLSWNTAWKGDQIVRMMTYNHLKNNGMDPREAAQVAAKFHGDYASVPPTTRKQLNKIFFTPTFKITMGKLYGDMAKGVLKTAFAPRATESKEKTYAKGLLLSVAFLEGRRYFMTHVLGYEEEQKYRRYVKEVETEEGIKESVITVADPLNIPWRYYYRGKSAIDDPDLNKVSKLFDQLKYDMTPLMRVGFELVENRYENVYKEGDDADRQLGSAALFVTKELIGITKPLIEAQEKPDEFKTESWKVMQKELGTLNSLIMQPFVFHYARDTKDKRLSLAIYRLQNNFKMALRTSESPEQQQRIVSNFYTELEKLQKELDEYYSKK